MRRISDDKAIGEIVAMLIKHGTVTLIGVRSELRVTSGHCLRLMEKCGALGVAHLHSEYPWKVWRVGPARPIPADWMEVLRFMGRDLSVYEWAERMRLPVPSVVAALRDVQAEREVA